MTRDGIVDESVELANLRLQIGTLAQFISEHVPDEPLQNEGAVDTAIRVMTRWQAGASAAAWDSAMVTTLGDLLKRVLGQGSAPQASRADSYLERRNNMRRRIETLTLEIQQTLDALAEHRAPHT